MTFCYGPTGDDDAEDQTCLRDIFAIFVVTKWLNLVFLTGLYTNLRGGHGCFKVVYVVRRQMKNQCKRSLIRPVFEFQEQKNY